MSDLNGILTQGYLWRELWFPEIINNHATLPSSKDGGQPVTLTGARKGTTVDGAHGDASATSNIVTAADAVLNNQAKFWVLLRFKFDQTFETGSGDQYICTKRLAADDYIDIWFENDDGLLYFRMGDRAGGTQFTLTSTTNSWTAGVWYTVLCSLSDTGPAQRLLVNGTAEDTDTVAAINTPNGGDLVILSSADGNADGFRGTVSWAVVGTDDLTQTADTGEEALLNKGIPPADAVNMYLYDEGRGLVAVDRGSGADNGVIDTGVTWDFGTVKLAALSLDGINDHGESSAGVDISGDLSLVLVVKAKSTYTTLAADHDLVRIRVDANNLIKLEYENTADAIRWHVIGGGTAIDVDYTTRPSIDDCLILIGTYDGETAVFYVNGAYIGSTGSGGPVSGAAATAYIGATEVVDQYDVSKPLLVGLVSGVLSGEEAVEVARRINNRLSLGLTIP